MLKKFLDKLNPEEKPIDKLNKLIELASEDHEITDREAELILKQAEKLGVDEEEAELVLMNAIGRLNKTDNSDIGKVELGNDGLDITNEELLIRTNKWVDLTSQPSYKGKIELFPTKAAGDAIEKSLNAGKQVLGSVAKNFMNPTAFGNPFNYIKAVNQLANGGDVVKKIDQNEIFEIANSYLIILEMRSQSDEFLKKKFDEISSKFQSSKEQFEENKNNEGKSWSLW